MEISNLEEVFTQKKVEDPREAAELAYVIAMIAKAAGKNEKATSYGKESIALFKSVGTDTLTQCAAIHTVVNGISVPSIIHEDVVKDRLRPILV